MANEGTLKKFIADLSAELKERQTITASQPARNDCPVCITLKLSDPCPHLWQSTIKQLATHYGQTENTLRLWVSIARHQGYAVVFVKTDAGEYLHFQANTYEEALTYFDHTNLTLRGITDRKRRVAYSLLDKLQADVEQSELTEELANSYVHINLKRIISECDNILEIIGAPAVSNMRQSGTGAQTEPRGADIR